MDHWQSDWAVQHADMLVRSHHHWTGCRLLAGEPKGLELAKCLFEAPFVVVSHGTETDPILNYGNGAALKLWEMTWEEFTSTPSRFTAEAPNREERARLLALVAANGYMDDYNGVRITRAGLRFEIRRATVWNLITPDGRPEGQAATFASWEWLASVS